MQPKPTFASLAFSLFIFCSLSQNVEVVSCGIKRERERERENILRTCWRYTRNSRKRVSQTWKKENFIDRTIASWTLNNNNSPKASKHFQNKYFLQLCFTMIATHKTFIDLHLPWTKEVWVGPRNLKNQSKYGKSKIIFAIFVHDQGQGLFTW